MKYHVLKLRDLTSGQALRNYRKRLSALGANANTDTSVLTTKFKLELPQGCLLAKDNVFADCRRLYDAVEGCGKGTLTYFLFSAVLAGFRIFATAPEATLFANRRVYDESSFRAALIEAVGAALPNFTIAKLLKRLKTLPRARENKDIRFIPEIIVQEFRKTLCKSSPRQANEEYVARLFEEIARQITLRFDSWRELVENEDQACAAVDEALKGFADFPNLQAMAKAAHTQLPEGSCIAFDDTLPFIELNEENLPLAPYAVVAMILSYPERAVGEKQASFVATHLTTTTASGLSWFFGKGLALFRTESVEKLCELYGVADKDRSRIEQVRNAALAIPEQTFLFKSKKALGYHDFRRSFSGRTDSWTSNYINRLVELKTMLQELGGDFKLPNLERNGTDFLTTTDCSRTELEVLCRAYADGRDQACAAIDHLLGGDATHIAADVATLEDYSRIINRLCAMREQLCNALDQAEKDKFSPWKSLLSEVKGDLEPWKKLERLPRLNQMSGGVPHAREEIQETTKQLVSVLRGRQEHFESVMAWAESVGDKADVIETISTEQSIRAQRRAPGKYDGRELAVRWVLQRIARVVRDRYDECADAVRSWFAENDIFARKTDFNKFFCNHLGTIYVSPFSQRRHQGYALGAKVVEHGDALWQSFLDFLKLWHNGRQEYGEALETWLRLTGLTMSLRVSALKHPVPGSVAALHLEASTIADVVPEGVRLQLNLPEVAPSVLAKAFNSYESLVSGALIVLRRERFFLRTKFLWVDNNTLVYVPKDRKWTLPERYAHSAIWQKIFDLDILVRDDSGAVDVRKSFARALAVLTKPEARDAVRELLHQLPHDWSYELPLRNDSSGKGKKAADPKLLEVMLVFKDGSKGTQLAARRISCERLARLVGPSLHKERLNQLLLDPRTTVGDMTLLADQEVLQTISPACADVNLSRGSLVFSLAVPISTPVQEVVNAKNIDKQSSPAPFKRIVAIDQGETGFAFAVFNLEDAGNSWAQPISQGVVRIPSIRRLIRNVRTYRKGRQAIQKFSQRYDSTMFTMRENAAGDVCGAIAGLMNRYGALPVLEYQVSQLASGGKQLELVYKMVNARFVADRIPAHETERTAWWYGARGWTVPGYWQEVSENFAALQKSRGVAGKEILERDGRFYRRLYVSPGATVNASWTSRICSHCGGNVSELIAKAQEAGIKEVQLDDNGEVTLLNQTLRLYKRPTEKESKAARRRNERADWTSPMAGETLSLKDLHKAALSNLRRPPKSLQIRDTSQSLYFCVFKNCQFHNREQHADINAAINIGRRFMKTLLKD